ncbi:MAG TPA: polyketide synthase dehydratase domain-containing protein, partial [Solirubrobacteraceae bacterium]|nr:polyketide synthase dehydratase domain-containing protein [Solirubrobacteraceae bacterium]
MREGALFTGRISLQSHEWLRDHVVFGMPLLPGTVFLELALHAAERLDCGLVEELTLSTPLVLDEHGVVHVQVRAAPADEEGRRELSVFSRKEGSSDEWVRHASGFLASSALTASPLTASVAEWPPPGASPVESVSLYDLLAAGGYEYGPAFQGLREIFSLSGEVYASVELGETLASGAGGYRVHPALADAALQAIAVLRGLESLNGAAQVPFSFSGVRVYQPGASSLRLQLSDLGKAVRLVALDAAGEPVFSIDSVQTRALDRRLLSAAQRVGHDDLFAVRWVGLPAPDTAPPTIAVLGPEDALPGLAAVRYPDLETLETAIAGGVAQPDHVVAALSPPAAASDLLEAAHELTNEALELLQAWLASERLADSRLVALTRGALVARPGEAPDLSQAAVPGLVRSAHSEHPDRYALVDVDGSEASGSAIPAALASDEPEVAIREGSLYVPRVGRAAGGDGLVPPVGVGAWRLGVESPGSLESLALSASPVGE